MSQITAPIVDCTLNHAIVRVSDVAAAVDFYTTKLGFVHGFSWGDPPEIAGVNLGSVSIHLSGAKPDPRGDSVYFVVGDANELCAYQVANGVKVTQPLQDKPYGLRDYWVHDLYGNNLGFGHYIYNQEPPIKIERVDVPVRLEKRLAAVLQDLAEHKGMSISSTLEETLLHTFEPFGDSVASPHTKRTLRYIEELKKKHGIDYDSHGSYRFVEE